MYSATLPLPLDAPVACGPQYHRRLEQELATPVQVVLCDSDIAGVYINSERANAEFPDTTAPFRTAVAVGRFHQDAVRELCAMWQLHGQSPHTRELRAAGVATPGDDLLCLSLHPLQSEVAPTMLLKAAERVMVEVGCVGRLRADAAILWVQAHDSAAVSPRLSGCFGRRCGREPGCGGASANGSSVWS